MIYRNRKIGISLIVLVVTIISTIIISSTVIYTIIDTNILENAKKSIFQNNIKNYYNELNEYYINKYTSSLNGFDLEDINATNILNDEEGVPKVTSIIKSMKNKSHREKISIKNGEFVFDNFKEEEKVWIEEIKKSYPDLVNNDITDSDFLISSNQIYKQQGVNEPIFPTENNKISIKENNGINAVGFDENNKATIVTNIKEDWYSYKDQSLSTDKINTSNWANIQTKDGSQFVWIPRFAYKITKGSHTTKLSSIGSNNPYNGLNTDSQYTTKDAGSIHIKFLKNNTNEFWDGTGYAETNPDNITYNSDGVQSDYLVHPGFCFEKEITGFWVAKYEASSVQGNGNDIKYDNVLNTKQIQIKSGYSSWRFIEANNMFGNVILMGTINNDLYGFKKNTNTHIIKNDEWGAVSYLAHSQYGVNGNKIEFNSSLNFITGSAGIKSTTTGNNYGVYDMVGGAHDAVAGIYETKEVEIDKLLGDSKKVRDYFNIYSKYENKYKGDAIYETSLRQYVTTAWFSSFSWLVDTTESYMIRGGSSQTEKTAASIFAFHRYKNVFYHLNKISFRPTITLDYLY